MSKRIMIDPGHFSKYNRSPVVPEYYEGDRVYKLSQYLIEALRKYDFVVSCTKRSIDDYPKTVSGTDNVYKRGTMSKGCNLLISLHSNACNTEAVNRAVVIHPLSGAEKALGADLGGVIKSVMGLPSYQLYSRENGSGRDYYGVIRGAADVGVPCLILEHSFHTNKAAAQWLLSDDNLKRLAEAEAETIAKYYDTPVAVQNGAEQPEFYRVRKSWSDVKSQTGAFEKLSNAKKQANENGYNVYDNSGKCVYSPSSKSNKVTSEIALEVIAGKWGVGEERKQALTAAGYNYYAVQKEVNRMLS